MLSLFPLLVVVTLSLMFIQDYFSAQQQKKIEAEQVQQLQQPILFGEVMMPKGTWINRGGSIDYPMNSVSTDVRQGLEAARFPTPVVIASVSVHAFSLHNTLVVELAEDYELKSGGAPMHCPAGWVLQFAQPEEIPTDVSYSSNSYDWFKPSLWQPMNCFDAGPGGVTVLIIGEYGVDVGGRSK